MDIESRVGLCFVLFVIVGLLLDIAAEITGFVLDKELGIVFILSLALIIFGTNDKKEKL